MTLAFHIYHSGQGNQGILGQVSKQQLDAVFGTTKEDDAIIKILENGHLQAGSTYLRPNTNLQRSVATTSRAATAPSKGHARQKGYWTGPSPYRDLRVS